MINHVELQLYFGICSAGSSEGKYSLDNEWAQARFRAGREVVERFLRPSYEWGLHYGLDNFVRNEKEALLLIDFAKKNIKGAVGGFALYDCIHGSTRFFRKIIIPCENKAKIKDITRILKNSEFKPKTHSEKYGICLEDFYPAKKVLKIRQKEIEKAWEDTLKYKTEPPENFCET